MHPTISDVKSSGRPDRVTERQHPSMLEEYDRRRGVIRNVLNDVPNLIFIEDVDAVSREFGAGIRANQGPF